jgi:hypothetical protein
VARRARVAGELVADLRVEPVRRVVVRFFPVERRVALATGFAAAGFAAAGFAAVGFAAAGFAGAVAARLAAARFTVARLDAGRFAAARRVVAGLAAAAGVLVAAVAAAGFDAARFVAGRFVAGRFVVGRLTVGRLAAARRVAVGLAVAGVLAADAAAGLEAARLAAVRLVAVRFAAGRRVAAGLAAAAALAAGAAAVALVAPAALARVPAARVDAVLRLVVRFRVIPARGAVAPAAVDCGRTRVADRIGETAVAAVAAADPTFLAVPPRARARVPAADRARSAIRATSPATSAAASPACRCRFATCFWPLLASAFASWRSRFDSVARAASSCLPSFLISRAALPVTGADACCAAATRSPTALRTSAGTLEALLLRDPFVDFAIVGFSISSCARCEGGSKRYHSDINAERPRALIEHPVNAPSTSG